MCVVSVSLLAQGKSSVVRESDLMNEDPFNLKQVVITATRTPKKLKDTPVITQVITAKQIAERGIDNIKDLLTQEVAGLSFQEVGFGTSIELQGLSSKHILFLIDGERIAGENGGNIDYSRINMHNIERIEIIKGASSALYGSQAMGGIINIITKGANKKFQLSAIVRLAEMYEKNYDKVDSDDFNRTHKINLDKPNLSTNLSIGSKLKNITLRTDIMYKSVDAYQLFDKVGEKRYFPKYDLTIEKEKDLMPTSISGYEDIQIAQKVKYEVSDKLTLSARGTFYMKDKYDFVANNAYDRTKDLTIGVESEYKINQNSYAVASFHADYYDRSDKYEKMEGGNLKYKNNMLQPRVMYYYNGLKGHSFTAGLEMFSESLYGDKFENNTHQSKSQWYATMLFQDEWKISDRWSVVGGLRADYHKEYKANITPKISAMYKHFPFTLRLNYARGYRSPSLKELYMNWDHLGMFWIYGNSSLKPESNNYLSASVEYTNKWINISANVYGNWFRNKIEGMWTNGQKELHYTNVGRSKLMGLEAMCRVRVTDNINFNGSYNYLLKTKDDKGVQLSSSSPHTGTLRAEYRTNNVNYNTVVNVTGMITGSKEFDVLGKINVGGNEVEAYYKANIKAYSLWNITVSQQIKQHFNITLGVNNLLNYTADRITFNSSTTSGRNIFATVSYVM